MNRFALRDTLTLMAAGLSLVWFGAYLASLVRARRPALPLSRFLLGAPLWFVTPRQFFVDEKITAPWRGLLWWMLFVLLAGSLARVIPIWLS